MLEGNVFFWTNKCWLRCKKLHSKYKIFGWIVCNGFFKTKLHDNDTQYFISYMQGLLNHLPNVDFETLWKVMESFSSFNASIEYVELSHFVELIKVCSIFYYLSSNCGSHTLLVFTLMSKCLNIFIIFQNKLSSIVQ